MDLELEKTKWLEFRISSVFDVYTGAQIPKHSLSSGKVPRITATDTTNGVANFHKNVANKNYRSLSNFLSVSFLGSVFYHPYNASLDMKIHALKIKGGKLNKYLAKFLIIALKKSMGTVSYGNQISSSDLAKKKIFIPVDNNSIPNYAFMESYIRHLEKKENDRYSQFATRKLLSLQDYKEVGRIEDKQWGEFFIQDVANILSGHDIYEKERVSGDIPYVSATANNNGIGYFVGNNNETNESGCLSVNRNGSVGYSFYHPYKALFSNDCRKLRLKNPSKYIGLFISHQITLQRAKYGYGYKMGTARLKRQKIILPINNVGKPDFEFMENYMKRLEFDSLKKYLSHKSLE